MFTLVKPTNESIGERISQQSRLGFTYPEVGGTAGDLPAGYDHDVARIDLGNGIEVFDDAVAALRQWQQFQVGWAEAVPPDTLLMPDETFAIRARIFGIWTLAFGRIVRVFDDAQPLRRFGFSFGTLPDHPEQGEEQFSVLMNANDRVSYEARAFFRPNMLVAKMGWPYFRYRFNQFRRESARSMRHAVKSDWE